MLTLHSFRRCPFAIRVRMVLEEKQIPFLLIEEDLGSPSQELLKLHPEGRVPVLVDPESPLTAIYQSTIITEYLDEKYPQIPLIPQLMPQSPAARAQVRLWTYWCDHLFKPNLDEYKYEHRIPESLPGLLSHWNSSLEHSEYLVENRYSLADIHLFPFARQFSGVKNPAGPQLSAYPFLDAWLKRILERPAFERVMEARQ
jgi:glutathione S-transferase